MYNEKYLDLFKKHNELIKWNLPGNTKLAT